MQRNIKQTWKQIIHTALISAVGLFIKAILQKSNGKYNPQALMKLIKQARWLHCYKEQTVKIKLHLLSSNKKLIYNKIHTKY